MSSSSGNPFVFPGMGLGNAPGDPAGNPLLQSMEMMRQAWSSLGGAMPFGGSMPANPILHPEELDRRIQEMQAVANWLRLNLSMLQGSIQALEVQRATIATLHSFASGMGMPTGGGQAQGSGGPSPLDVALAAKPGPRNAEAAGEAPAAAAQPDAAQGEAGQSASAAAGQQPTPQQAWWNLLQAQFNQIASAAAATLPGADKAPADAPQAKPRARAAAPRKAARKSAPRKGG